VLSLLLAAALAGGCQRSRRQDTSRGPWARPVAVVNAEEITFQDFQTAYQNFLSHWDRFIQNNPDKKQELKDVILKRMIEDILLDQEARRSGLDMNTEAFTAKVREAIAPYDDLYLEQATEASHQTVAEWNRAFRRRLVHERLINREVLARIQVTDREVSRYYEQNRKQFQFPDQVKVRHLCVGTRRTYDRMRKLIEEGTDFAQLVRDNSITPDRQFDGDLGYVERGVMPPEFDAVIFRMTRVGGVNDLNKPVQTEIGYHIFRLEDRREARQLPLGEATPQIRAELIRQKQSEAYQIWLGQLRDRATIIVDEDLLKAEMG
jgi:parvulin-like peptidyl-prolyl isomerase